VCILVELTAIRQLILAVEGFWCSYDILRQEIKVVEAALNSLNALDGSFWNPRYTLVMPLELGVWRIDTKLQKLNAEALDFEARLESILDQDISIASPGWMVIGRQVLTPHGKFIDLLAVDSTGNLVVLELKRDKTEREVVAQLLDYGSWVRGLRGEDIGPIFNAYRKKYHPSEPDISIDTAFCNRFGTKSMPDEMNGSHELVIVGSSFDASTERIVNYLHDEYGVRINAIFFRVFRDGDRELLTRAWLRDPTDSDEGVVSSGTAHGKIEWNGEYYVSYGDDESRSWDDACKYGFISGGGGQWYSRTLNMLSVGDRIWVNVPGSGFVGVGIVESESTPVSNFSVQADDGSEIPILEMPLVEPKFGHDVDNLELCEHLVKVRWLKILPKSRAVSELGFFGNQNTVARPRNAKWIYTIDRLKEKFGIE